ncbi:uncharacterized protein LOC106669372 isoform X2 [Cimex lectularius]|uniref:LisH domain-containing protein n=1 Tax=Cimex lectularius TaxID=79782 RepID=A0A8I6RZ41_CIMLE|nr:uncharacterized protein LOC106669372 isoform X2 [Cimex lectularius]
MESLLPSEVARLVFGYLEDEECAEAAQNFLETSPHLKECLNTSKKGKRFSSKILGLNLVELLDLLSDLVSIVRDHDKYIDWENYDKSRLSVLLKTLNFVETGKHKSSSTIGSIGMVQRRSNSNTSMVQNSGTFRDMGWDTKLQILRKTEITSTKENECVPHVRPRCKSGNCHKNPHVVPGPVRSKTRTVFFIRDHDKMTEPCDIRICGAGNETLGYIENQRGVTVPMISNNNTDSSSNEMLTSSLTLESYNTINIKQEHKIEDSMEECDKNKTISLGMPEHEPPIAINMLPAADIAKSSAGRLETTVNKITNPISSQSSLLQHPLNLYQMVGYNQHNVPNVQLTYCVPNVQIACSSQSDDAQYNNSFQQGTKCPNGNPVNVTNGEEVWKNPHVRSTVVGRIGKSRVNKNSHKMRTQVPKIESLDMAQHQEHLVSSSSLKFRKIAPKVSQTIANNLQVQMVQSSSSMIDAGEDMEPLVKRSLRSRKRQ